MKTKEYWKTLEEKFLITYKRNKEKPLFKLVLIFISAFYSLIYKTRLFLYENNILKKVTLKANVISIGNITSGGTGKTPLTIELARFLIKKGYKVAVISRGYKRKTLGNNQSGVILVSDGQDILSNPEICGDEPYLIANKVKEAFVIVSSNKLKAANAAIKLEANVLILDDGYQSLKLNRDENILLLDSSNPFDNGHLLPAGYLRETPDSIKRATAIVFTNSRNKQTDEINYQAIKNYIDTTRKTSIISMSYNLKKLKALNIKKSIAPGELKGNVLAFCGIGNPKSFFNLLSEAKISVSAKIEFLDHQEYAINEMNQIISLAQKYKIENVITTEKDAVKIEELCQSCPMTFWACETDINFQPEASIEFLLNKKSVWKDLEFSKV